jgi:hypothetical protein
MSGELKKAADGFVAALDAMDVDRMMQAVTEDAQGVDEISRRWLRDRAEFDSCPARFRSDHSGPPPRGRRVEDVAVPLHPPA